MYLAVRTPYLLGFARHDPSHYRALGVLRALDGPMPPALHQALVVLLLLTGAAFLVGYRHRVLAPLHALLLLVVLTHSNSWGMILHTDNLFTAHVGVLAFAPAADALSIDARGRPVALGHARYGWAPRLMVAIAAATYCLAGVAKVRNGGLEFVGGETLRNLVAYDNLRKLELGSVYSPLGAALVSYPGFFGGLAWASLALELGAPLALAPRVGRAWGIAMWSFHVGVLALMAIGFAYPLSFIAFAPLFEVERVWRTRALAGIGRRLGVVASRS